MIFTVLAAADDDRCCSQDLDGWHNFESYYKKMWGDHIIHTELEK
jgi:hypothetical protein